MQEKFQDIAKMLRGKSPMCHRKNLLTFKVSSFKKHFFLVLCLGLNIKIIILNYICHAFEIFGSGKASIVFEGSTQEGGLSY